MHFATLIPDWNSLDSVRRVHSDLEAAALVFFALLVLFDILAHLSINNKKKTLLEKIGLCCFAIAVLAEVVAYPYGQRNDTLSGQAIGSLDAETREALTKSRTALAQSKEAETKSGDAIDKAGRAQDSLGNAENEANRAQRASSNALGIANDAKQVSREARQEADSFERDIKSATKQAAEAESHLADALQRAASAEAELKRMKTPRSLTNASVVTVVLKEFKGTEYTVSGCFQDQESIDLLVQLDTVLANAGWKRVKPSPQSSFGDIQLNISKDFAVPTTIRSGIYVEVQSAETLDALKATPQPMLPMYIKGALTLRGGLASGIIPADANLVGPLPIDPGNSTSVFILVGKKP